MIEDIEKILQSDCKLDSTRITLIGVSGGADSLCLLDLLVNAGYPVVAAHLDHNLRAESARDAEFVRQTAQGYPVEFVLGTADVNGYASARGLSIEEAARHLRYRFLFQQASRYHAQAVAVGHNADDQVETIMMHLLRGSGATGLLGMAYHLLPNAWSQEIPLVRPLLDVSRSDILAYCHERQLQPVEDVSNRDVKYFRNRLRIELLPLLETYNPRFREALLRMASVLQADELVLAQVGETAWQNCVQQQGVGFIGMSVEALKDLPLALQRRVVRRAVSILREGMQDQDFRLVEQALSFLNQPPSTRQVDLALGLRLLMEGNTVWVAGWEADLPVSMWPQLGPGEPDSTVFKPDTAATYEMGNGWVLCIQPVDLNQFELNPVTQNPNPFQAWLDIETLGAPLFLRARNPGDRFKPLGTDQAMHLSDFMVNRKMPQRARDRWPLVCAGDKIVWIPGYGINHDHRIKPTSRKMIRLELARSGSQAV